MLKRIYLITGLATLALYVLIEVNGWELFGHGGQAASSGGRQGSGTHWWGGIGGGK
jgi:hypothetical protein